jgi:hypothetical protein
MPKLKQKKPKGGRKKVGGSKIPRTEIHQAVHEDKTVTYIISCWTKSMSNLPSIGSNLTVMMGTGYTVKDGYVVRLELTESKNKKGTYEQTLERVNGMPSPESKSPF